MHTYQRGTAGLSSPPSVTDAMLTALDHVVIAVSDLEIASKTYASLFGLPSSWRGEHPGAGTANTLFRLENTYVELLATAGEGPSGDLIHARVANEGEGPLAIALGTDDLRATVSELRSRGIECEDPSPGEGRSATSGAKRQWLSVVLPLTHTRGVPLRLIQHLSAPASLPRAPVADGIEPAASVAAVDHVVIMCSDADAAIVLYRDTLGLRLALDRTFEQRGVRLLFFRVGGTTLECAVPLVSGSSGFETDRFWGVSYRVADIEAARERLVVSGFDVSEVRTGLKPGTRVCTVRRETHGVATLLIGTG